MALLSLRWTWCLVESPARPACGRRRAGGYGGSGWCLPIPSGACVLRWRGKGHGAPGWARALAACLAFCIA
eukprot:scaffold66899_cov64-Phaeocystis_antarctica.AAC.5